MKTKLKINIESINNVLLQDILSTGELYFGFTLIKINPNLDRDCFSSSEYKFWQIVGILCSAFICCTSEFRKISGKARIQDFITAYIYVLFAMFLIFNTGLH